MRVRARVAVSATVGIVVAALVGLFALGADGSGQGLQNHLWDMFTIPGGMSLKLSHGGASSLLKPFLGRSGPGPASLQMLLVSFIVWATLIGTLTFVFLRARVTRTI